MAPYLNGFGNDDHRMPDSVTTANASDLVIFASSRAIIQDTLTPATIIASSATGKILAIFDSVLPPSEFPQNATYNDYTPHVLLPGLVDAHVHLNEPGRTEWEGFWHGTRAAAFGGVTTVIDMPLNAIPPTTTVANLREKVAAAKGKCWVDVGFYGGIVPGNVAELKPLVRAGVRGFKGFLIDSGVEEFPAVSTEDVAEVFRELANEPTTVMFHAEMLPDASTPPSSTPSLSTPSTSTPSTPPHEEEEDEEESSGPSDSYQTFLASRPSTFETHAIQSIIDMAHLAPELSLHIVHLSAMEAIPLLREARASGVRITAETCFHYLSLAAEGIPAGDTRHKCCPPIREQSNQDGLWDELLRQGKNESVIQTVVSDHSPCTPELKLLPAKIPGSHVGSHGQKTGERKNGCHDTTTTSLHRSDSTGDFLTAWGGISSVGLGLSILWTEAIRRRHLDPESTLRRIVQWCCINTAKQVGLEARKGDFRVGMDADVAVFDTEARWAVEPRTMLFRNKCSPYEGRVLKGVVRETWVRGRKVHSREGGFEEKIGPEGVLLLERREGMVKG